MRDNCRLNNVVIGMFQCDIYTSMRQRNITVDPYRKTVSWSHVLCFFFQAEDGIRDVERSRGLGDVYKRQDYTGI